MEFELLCINCKNYNIKENNCNAFPNGIPYEVYVGLDNHSEIIKGQKGQFIFDEIKGSKRPIPEND